MARGAGEASNERYEVGVIIVRGNSYVSESLKSMRPLVFLNNSNKPPVTLSSKEREGRRYLNYH